MPKGGIIPNADHHGQALGRHAQFENLSSQHPESCGAPAWTVDQQCHDMLKLHLTDPHLRPGLPKLPLIDSDLGSAQRRRAENVVTEAVQQASGPHVVQIILEGPTATEGQAPSKKHIQLHWIWWPVPTEIAHELVPVLVTTQQACFRTWAAAENCLTYNAT